ncbi:CHASE2 domain-containing protein [Aureimonas leprariae]|uniref:Adenylate/guanylate cyclase domain-containing protein n=1 Tax=Plantimonas leprariae TaxID=2615207 RepID=A0A7V7PTF8_9HYPH|nr:adenylate/guanylate cyclase domain-containing protein [Aureimonas leprariae]KAB0682933.1 adenylate/guanylate cyclase domain-containing protein [Aureimonas leprariae]
MADVTYPAGGAHRRAGGGAIATTRRWFGVRSRREALIVWSYGLATLIATIAFAGTQVTVLDRFKALVFDAYQRVLPREEAHAPILLVDVDEASIAQLGQWPWPRSALAKIVDRLGELGAATIAFDMVFPEADRTSPARVAAELQKAGIAVVMPAGGAGLDNDALLAESFGRSSVVAGFAVSGETDNALPEPKTGFAYAGRDPTSFMAAFSGGVANLAGLDAAARGTGFFSFPPSRDGIVRRIPLVANAQGRLQPSLSVEALRVAQGASTLILRTTSASGETDSGRPAVTALKVGDFEVPTTADGSFWIYFSGLPSVKTVSASVLLDPEASQALADEIAGHIVVVGTSALGLRDLVATPVAASMPGMRVHAEVIDQIFGGVFLSQPDWAHGLEVAAAALAGLMLLVVIRQGSATFSAVSAVTLVGIVLAGSWFAFSRHRLLVDPILPTTAVVAVFAITMPLLLLLTNREKKFVRGAFSHYLAPALVERLADNPALLKLGGEERELTILFSDIRSFTSISEKLGANELTTLLNNFLTPMTDVLLRSEATIDKYMGDAIVAFWNAPLDIADHRRRACLGALAMVRELELLNARSAVPLKIGIGLNNAVCCVGNLGSAQRFSYSAIGDGMNVASRVEGLTKEYGVAIAVTEAVRAGAPDLAFVAIDLVRVVGRAEPLPLFALVGDADFAGTADFRGLAAAHGAMIEAYRAGRFAEAKASLDLARSYGFEPLAKLHRIYAERLALLEAAPVPADWDGVFTARSK